MSWTIYYHYAFEAEVDELPDEVQIELLARVERLVELGPKAKRPMVDTLKGSKHANMKELRFKAVAGVWRVAFAFDPQRHGILLVAGDKSGVSSSEFYRSLIGRADARFDEHLVLLEKDKKKRK